MWNYNKLINSLLTITRYNYSAMRSTQNEIDIVTFENRTSNTYLSYYITNLLTNALFLSLYFVQIYVDHPKCIYNKSGVNYTTEFDIAFIIGGAVHAAEFINTDCVCIFFRYKVKNEEEELFDSKSRRTYLQA